jgi:hypothetical protein
MLRDARRVRVGPGGGQQPAALKRALVPCPHSYHRGISHVQRQPRVQGHRGVWWRRQCATQGCHVSRTSRQAAIGQEGSGAQVAR